MAAITIHIAASPAQAFGFGQKSVDKKEWRVTRDEWPMGLAPLKIRSRQSLGIWRKGWL